MMKQKKFFTPDEANRTLPLVRRIVQDILQTGVAMRRLGRQPDPSPEEVKQYGRLTDRLKDLFAELEDLGCYYKDWNFTMGLVDFPAILRDEEVLLCWRSDEPEVMYYHPHDAGYAGRRRIPEAMLRAGESPARPVGE
jgi:hypothetical protein